MITAQVRALFATIAQLFFAACLHLIAILAMGLAIFPGILLIYYVWTHTFIYFVVLRMWLLCVSLVLAYFVYGFSLISILGLLRIVLRLNLKEGEYRIASIGMMRWMFINALYTIVSITFMDFILLTPIAPLFFSLMGAKVGKTYKLIQKSAQIYLFSK